MNPPVPAVRPHPIEKHGHVRIDDYYWLCERTNPEVIAHLEAENAYLNAALEHLKPLRSVLFDEFTARIRQTDESVPYERDGFFYYTRTEAGKNYPVVCRKEGSVEAPEQILVDGNAEAQGHAFFSLGSVQVSPDNALLAWGADTAGRRFYTYRFRDLSTGQNLPDVLADITPSVAWASDNRTLFYTRQHPETLRAYQIWKHVLGTDVSADKLMYEETDETFSCSVHRTKSGRYLLIDSSQTITNEWRYLDADQSDGDFRIIEPRTRGHEYDVDHYGDFFYIRTNDEERNFRLVRAPVDAPGHDTWQEVIPGRPDTLLSDVAMFRDFMVVSERRAGLVHLQVRPWSGNNAHYIEFDEPAYAASLAENYEFNTGVVRFSYSSLTTPRSVYDYDVVSGSRTLLKRDEVLAGFDSASYVSERLAAPAQDGVKVPVSLVYRKGIDASGPLLLYGYGAYGISMDAAFNPFIVSLLDRGFVYAIAHIRGGQENGRQWYDDGRLLNKKNTFQDFISVADFLVTTGYADPQRLYAMGGSAGGLLMGAVMNMRPFMWHGIVAAVPFVDVVTTMLDDTVPLTTFEYDEWGNPNEKQWYDYMLSYSPYDGIANVAYPNLLAITGINDSQVQYWEPAKWVAKLRARTTGHNRVLFYINMDAGHGGASARYKRYEEIALQYSFLIDLAGPQSI